MIIAIIVLIIMVIVLAYINVKNRNQTKDENKVESNMPYTKKYLLTKNEWAFYKKIKPICDKNNIHIISKVRLADIIEVKKGLDNQERQKYFNKIINKHIDFILCNPENLAILALVELDDKSHERKERIESDNFKNNLFKTVGYKLIRTNQQSDFEKILIENGLIKNIYYKTPDGVTAE